MDNEGIRVKIAKLAYFGDEKTWLKSPYNPGMRRFIGREALVVEDNHNGLTSNDSCMLYIEGELGTHWWFRIEDLEPLNDNAIIYLAERKLE